MRASPRTFPHISRPRWRCSAAHWQTKPNFTGLACANQWDLIVTGLPRSGTTFLHRLLCEVPDARPIPFYEHIRPIRRSSRFDFRRFEIEAKFFPWKLVADQYNMDAIHYVRPNEPDECNFALRIGMRSIVFWETAYIPSYLHWLLSQDMTVAYRDYRRVLLFHILTD